MLWRLISALQVLQRLVEALVGIMAFSSACRPLALAVVSTLKVL